VSHQVRGVIARSVKAPVEVVTINVPDPGPGEALVKVQACGVCHTDLHYREGGINDNFPFLLGHEAAGIVEEVGPGVAGIEPGDHVVAAWSPSCGQCRFCKAGRRHLCNLADDPTSRATDRMTAAGTPLASFLGVGGFAERIILADNAVIPIDREMPLDRAALLGCAVITGYGAAQYAARVRAGDDVAVFGCGGVGLNIVQGARLAGAGTIIAVDLDDAKLEMAGKFGATHTLRGDAENLHKQIRALTREKAGLDFAFEAVGNPEIARIAFLSIAKGGEVILVGIAHMKEKVALSQIAAVTQEKGMRGTTNGSADSWKTVPLLVDLYRKRELKLDELVSRTYSLDEINDAMADLRSGRNARGVVIMD